MVAKIEKLKQKAVKIIESWNIADGNDKLNKWISQFSQRNEQELMLELLCSFYYYSRNKLANIYIKLFNKFEQKYSDWEKNTVFSKVFSDKTGHSEIFYTEFCQANNLMNSYATPYPDRFIMDYPSITRVAIIDDFSGSGDTFIKTIENYKDRFFDKEIIFLVNHITRSSKNKITNYAEKRSYKIRIIGLDISDKTFESRDEFKTSKYKYARIVYNNLCKKFPVNYPFGYADIEALVSFYYNTPNNTLGLFWQKLDNYFSFFDRKNRIRPHWVDMKNDRLARKSIVLYPIKNIDIYRMLLFTTYCVRKADDFSVKEACKDFGFTEEQVTFALNYIIKNSLVENKKGKYIETDKLSQAKFKRRFAEFLNIFPMEAPSEIYKFTEKDYTPLNFSNIFKGYKAREV